MLGVIFRLVRLVTLLSTLAVLGAVALLGYLVFAGGDSPPNCAPQGARPLERVARSIAFDAKLGGFLLASGRGFLNSISFDESETAARAESYFQARTDRVSDLVFCFRDGEATGFARVEVAFGRRIGISGKGTLDVSGAHPRLRLDRATVAGIALPAFVRRQLESGANQELDDIPVFVPLKLQFSMDRVTVTR